MKKVIIALGCLLFLFSNTVFANAVENLQKRLANVDGFYAKFTQVLTSPDQQIIQEGEGELWAQRPNLFYWDMQSPDKSELISDGKTLWMYQPDIEQVTSLWLESSMSNPLFLLILNNDQTQWQHYHVSQSADTFTLTSRQEHDNQQTYKITVTPNGFVSSFSVIESDGQTNSYNFSHQRKETVSAQKFHFSVPKNVTWDDQRQ